jgi:outer membrane protein
MHNTKPSGKPPGGHNINPMKHPFLRTCFSIAALALAASATCAADATMGVINARRILSESRVAKESMAKFQTDFASRGKEVIDQTSLLKQKADELDKLLPTLSPVQQQERQRDLATLNRDLERKKQSLDEDREARKRDDIQRIIQLARGVVAHIAEDGKLAAVFQDVVYVNPKNDITDKVLQAMDAQKSN